MSMHGYSNQHVVVTGGTGALGTAVVNALLGAGAICHVPSRGGNAASKPASANQRPSLGTLGDLADESPVTRFYESLPELWASIHIAGGYQSERIEKSDRRCSSRSSTRTSCRPTSAVAPRSR